MIDENPMSLPPIDTVTASILRIDCSLYNVSILGGGLVVILSAALYGLKMP